MATYAVVNANGLVINRIVLDTPSAWPIPAGQSLAEETGAAFDIGGSYIAGVYTPLPVPPIAPQPQTVLSQDLMAQFTTADAAAIQAAIASNVQFWLLWQSLTTQRDPMIVSNARFLAGWNALIQVLGQQRMSAIAAALGVTVTI